jgi:carbamoylphosphate synthase large subunit
MNVLYLSPSFPDTAWQFCAALRSAGARVLSVGDEPLAEHGETRRAVDDYVFEPRMDDYAALHNAVSGLVARYGPLERIESNCEYWIEAEARLRGDFGVRGLQLADLQRQRSKLCMASPFEAAGIPYPPTVRADATSQVMSLATEHGFPLVFKPDVGSGAVSTFCVDNFTELEEIWRQPLIYHVAQPFVGGNIVTYDGLTDSDGNIVFATSHAYDVGIMQLRQAAGHDGFYYSLREVPRALAELGQRAVRAFGIRERFFHAEFFARADGSYVALEMNLRPPGGFTTDLMNYAADMDVYSLWAAIVTGQRLSGFKHDLKYHTAHAGRRRTRTYRMSDAELRHRLGNTLVAVRSVTPSSADTMGDTAYLLRHESLSTLEAAIALVQAV